MPSNERITSDAVRKALRDLLLVLRFARSIGTQEHVLLEGEEIQPSYRQLQSPLPISVV